jgi:hypothetical protein
MLAIMLLRIPLYASFLIMGLSLETVLLRNSFVKVSSMAWTLAASGFAYYDCEEPQQSSHTTAP